MKFKLNIIEPWESGTESAITANISRKAGNQFLLFVEKNIKVRDVDNAHYFVCKLKNDEDQKAFDNEEMGHYLINMVYDENIHEIESKISPLDSYRANFLLGELVIHGGSSR